MSSPLDSLRRAAASIAALVVTRLEFASVELAQARAQFMRWVGFALLAAILLMLALYAFSAMFVLLLWDRLGWMSLLVVGIVDAAVALWLIVRLRREIMMAPPLLAQTIEEIAQDRAALFDAVAAAPPPAAATRPGVDK